MTEPQRQAAAVILAAAVTASALVAVGVRFSSRPSLAACVTTIIIVGVFTFFLCHVLARGFRPTTEIPPPAGSDYGADTMLSAVLANLREGVIVVNSQTDIVLYNDAAAQILNLPRPELKTAARHQPNGNQSSHLPRLIEATRDPAVNSAFRRALAEKTGGKLRAELGVREARSYELQVNPSGENLAVGVFVDVTELERLERERRECFTNLSHELRTPLTAVIACAETLLDGALDDPKNNTRFLGKLYKQAMWMNELISRIVDLSGIESAGIKLEVEPVRLHDAVADAIALMEFQAQTANVTLISRVPGALLVQAERTRLGQILHNLIDNAVKFNRPGGTVTITAEEREEYAAIQITDTGIGVSAADLPRIFERLYRGDKSRSRIIEGAGLGLAIVKHLVQAHGGTITASSEVGRETTFTFTMPMAFPQNLNARLQSTSPWERAH